MYEVEATNEERIVKALEGINESLAAIVTALGTPEGKADLLTILDCWIRQYLGL